jgi:hypothetical protein
MWTHWVSKWRVAAVLRGVQCDEDILALCACTGLQFVDPISDHCRCTRQVQAIPSAPTRLLLRHELGILAANPWIPLVHSWRHLETLNPLKSVEISSHWKLALATNNRLAQHIWRIRWIPLVTKPYPLVKKWWTVMNHHIRMYQNHIWSTSYMAAALLPLQYHCDWTYQHLCQLPVREHPSKPKQHPRICVDVHVIGWIPEIVNRVLRYEYMEIKEMNPKRAAGANVKCEWSGDKN